MENDKKVNAEIEEMLTALGDPTPENLKDEDEEEEEIPEKKEDEEVLEKKEDEGEEETPPEKKKEDEDEGEEEETDKDKIIENLRRKLDEKLEAPEKKEEASPEKKEEKKEDPLKFEDQDFIGDLDLEDLTRDKVAFNKILNSVYSKGVNDSKKIATEGVLSSIPDIVKHNLTLLTTLKEASDNFYKDNADLTPFKRVVAAVFEDIASKNPDKKYGELMDLVAPEARKRLELHKQAVKKDEKEEDGKPPRLHGIKGGRHSQSHKPNTSALEKEISEMNSTLRR